jgi:hypothetical protein
MMKEKMQKKRCLDIRREVPIIPEVEQSVRVDK